MTTKSAAVARSDSLSESIAALKRGWWLVLGSALVLATFGLGMSIVQSPVYQSVATLYVTSGGDGNAVSAYQGSLASQQRVASYVMLVDSESVMSDALETSRLSMSVEEAKRRVSASTTPDTVLLSVEAQDTNRQQASVLANSVASSLVAYVANLEEPAAGGAPLAKLTVVTPASPGESPVSPRIYRNVALGFLSGALLGVLLVLARARLDTKVRSAEDLEPVGLPALGVIPRDSKLEAKGSLNFSAGASITAEAFRSLRTNLSFSNVDMPVKTIVVTSPNPGEGKSTTAINLAAALAEANNRVVIVDADLRRPTLAARLGVNGEVGLTNYLAGGAQLADVVQSTDVSGLDALASGSLPPTPAELLGSQRARVGFSELSSMYDYVVIDSPPILPVTDAVVLAQWADGVILVARVGRTTRPSLVAASSNLDRANAEVLGIVLNDASSASTSYSYAYYGESRDSNLLPRV